MTVLTTGDLYVQAMSATSAYLDTVRADQWERATPCTQWNARDIANHIIGENLWAVELLNGVSIAEVGKRLDGDLAGDDPAASYRASVRLAANACMTPDAMHTICHLSFGDYSGSAYVAQLLLDTVVHGWDIAKATGQDTRLDAGLVEACLPIAVQLTTQFRNAGVFGECLPFGPDADAQTTLLAIMGRNDDAPRG
jgi:uncharacterized protein (TIGR03086 family)